MNVFKFPPASTFLKRLTDSIGAHVVPDTDQSQKLAIHAQVWSALSHLLLEELPEISWHNPISRWY
jgi:hypothetical protein